MKGSDWLLLGGLGLGAWLLLSPKDTASGDSQSGIDSATGLPLGGSAGIGGGSPWPTLPGSPSTPDSTSTPSYGTRFTDALFSPESAAQIVGLTALTVGSTYLFSKRSVTGTRGETALPESTQEPITIRKPSNETVNFTEDFSARSPRLGTNVDLPGFDTFTPTTTEPSAFSATTEPFSGRGLAGGAALESIFALASVPGAAQASRVLQRNGLSLPAASLAATAGAFGNIPATPSNVAFARQHPIEAVPVLVAKGLANTATGTWQAFAHPITTVVNTGNALSNLIKPGSGTFRWTGFHF